MANKREPNQREGRNGVIVPTDPGDAANGKTMGGGFGLIFRWRCGGSVDEDWRRREKGKGREKEGRVRGSLGLAGGTHFSAEEWAMHTH